MRDEMDVLGDYYLIKSIPMKIWEQLSYSEAMAIEHAAEALQKDIAKEPLNVKKEQMIYPGPQYKPVLIAQFECPGCHHTIAFRTTITRCIECGQLLDWENFEWENLEKH